MLNGVVFSPLLACFRLSARLACVTSRCFAFVMTITML
jgi:hypothetical protein